MPYVKCDRIPKLDYFATYSQPSTYFNTENTCVSFFEYDRMFDGLYGLWNAIYYGVKELQEYYIERFKGVKYFITPDYSKCGDASEAENQHRQYRSRIASIWLSMNLDAIVIPLVSCANEIGMKYMLDGMEDCTVVAFNTKGPLGDPVQLPIFLDSVKYTVDHLKKLKTIYAYASTPNDEKVMELFRYAIDSGIDIIIPENMLRTRNKILGGDKHGSN
ncbi:MAG: DUF4417 domain-containing protein [Ruminococcaceae bacterium]|nr:DUF4417 domain-containing protein [Oscillospiraceae bacterium]